MQITLGNGLIECNTLTRDGRIGVLLRPQDVPRAIGEFTQTGGEEYYPEHHPDHVVIWLDKLESARILQDTVNEALLKMQGIPAPETTVGGETQVYEAFNKHMAQRHEELATAMRETCTRALGLIEQYTRPDFYMWLLHDYAGQQSDPYKRAVEAKKLLTDLLDSKPRDRAAAPVSVAGNDEGEAGSVEERLLFASDVCRNQQLRISELERRYTLLLRYADHLRGCASYTNSACTCGLQNAMRSFDVHDSDAAALRSGEGEGK